MRDPARINILLSKLGEFWSKYPDLRFGAAYAFFLDHHLKLPENQHIHNEHGNAYDTFNVEDDKWLATIEKQLEEVDTKPKLK